MSADGTVASPAAPSSMLDKVTAVVLTDERQVIGVFAGLDSRGNVLLTRVVMKKLHKSAVDGEERVITRTSNTLMIPFTHIKSIHQHENIQYDAATPNTN